MVSIGSLPSSDAELCMQGLICPPYSELYTPIDIHIPVSSVYATQELKSIYTTSTMDQKSSGVTLPDFLIIKLKKNMRSNHTP